MSFILSRSKQMYEKIGQKMYQAGVTFVTRSKNLAKDERGGLFEFILIALIVVVVLVGIYTYAKPEIDNFMKKIFGKMNSIN
ncbi:hypothetical protein M5X00_24330 [Paenibacillus alvei]|uniref:Flagellin Flp1-like domain-containing protein n=1 Tax=Paenibacillus alvei TaxID=44250 RepID=A0ABT4H7D8_PAEAL|nr:hypothetical protein [Paenibacillus alvei]EJW14336.1 hypothetical protein PAV_14c00290 [Paenibacillus alvei DSM 29]MCY9542848.1 hypothetical protein [Paenibacillus alvei]MCY9736097.1 hypothetical protein [Paenibacillus alvei]MCY9757358.1 hypothetical protein [Paenibacillus alvei]MCY9764903.1 hypothetical protein [Paenibacillus alvei]